MTHSTSSLSALLVSADVHAAATSFGMLESYGFKVSKTDDPALAKELCRGKRFDLAVYDQDTPGALGTALLATPHVVFGLVGPNKPSEMLGKRVHFVVQKPLSKELFGRTLKASYGAIALGRRHSFRHEVCIGASSCSLVHGGERRALKSATIVNVSQMGMCLQAAELLPQEATVQVNFCLPTDGTLVRATGTVVWAHASGRAGIKLSQFGSEGQAHYSNWLASMSPNLDDLLRRL